LAPKHLIVFGSFCIERTSAFVVSIQKISKNTCAVATHISFGRIVRISGRIVRQTDDRVEQLVQDHRIDHVFSSVDRFHTARMHPDGLVSGYCRRHASVARGYAQEYTNYQR